MAIRYNKDKYACVKSFKNEPLSQLTPWSKKCKLYEGKDETPAPSSHFGTPSSPTPSLEMITFTTPSTCSKGKGKAGKSVWEDPAIALGWDHIVITVDELRGLSSIPSYELVNCHIHKLVQVFYSATFYCWLSIYYWKNTYLFHIQDIRSGKLTDLLQSQLITFTM